MLDERPQQSVAKRLFHHLRPRIDEDPMHSGNGVTELLPAAAGQQQTQGVFPPGLLIEGNSLTLKDGVVERFRVKDPASLAPIIPLKIEKKALPLWRFVMQPNAETE